MQALLPIAEKIAARLIERRETIAIAESSTGGRIWKHLPSGRWNCCLK
jgi:nicotinamide-nucleotide amidase